MNKILKIFKHQIWSILILLVSFGCALGITLWKIRYEKVIPLITSVRDGILFAGVLLSIVVWAYLFFRRSRPLLQPEKKWRKIIFSLSSFLLQAILMIACVAIIGLWLDFYLFEDKFISKAESPDQKQEAYIYKWGILCGYSVYRRDAGEWVLHKFDTFGVPCEEYEQAKIIPVWSSNSQEISVRHRDGSEVPRSTSPNFFLKSPRPLKGEGIFGVR